LFNNNNKIDSSGLLLKTQSVGGGLYAMALSFCLSIRSFEHLYSPRMVGEIKEGKIGTATNKQ